MWWTLLPDSLPATAGLQAAGGAKGKRRAMVVQRSIRVEAASRPLPLEITSEVGHLQADTQTNEITLRTASYALVGLLPAIQGVCLICVHGDYWGHM